mgnify:CR=1 FL=1|tara:strand:- start:2266 stop:3444 length:1179 start_codon:yes stop_codon:yes gene_type:complete
MRRYRILVACHTLGEFNRGFEASFTQLREAFLGDEEFEIILVGGKFFDENYHSIPKINYIHRSSWIVRLSEKLPRIRNYCLESLSFGFGLFLKLNKLLPDIVLFSQPHVAPPLKVFRRFASKCRYILLFSNGGPSYLWYYKNWVDYTHFKAPWVFNEALNDGYCSESSFLIPNGFTFHNLAEAKRSKSSPETPLIDKSRKTIVSVAALCAEHKRMDFLISSIRPLLESGKYQMLCIGAESRTSAKLRQQFADLLDDGSLVFATLPQQQVRFYLEAADVFINGSLSEGFGRAIVEAVAYSVPVILHDTGDFRWLTSNAAHFIDIESPTAVRSAIEAQAECPPSREDLLKAAEVVRARFSWTHLKSEYRSMFRQILGIEPKNNTHLEQSSAADG